MKKREFSFLVHHVLLAISRFLKGRSLKGAIEGLRVSNHYIRVVELIARQRVLPARIIALEGIDQSGKRTQTRQLAKRLERLRFDVHTVSFPVYKSFTGRLIRRYLRGDQNYSGRALHMLYSLNRWENQELIQSLLRNADFLITDRYTPSNLAYGVSKGLDLKWLLNLDTGLPKADLVIILDVPVRSSFARKSNQRDVHEVNSELLIRVNRAYKRLGRELGWKIVDGGNSVKDVESEVWRIVRQRFRIPEKMGG
jgi:dTMP kinase